MGSTVEYLDASDPEWCTMWAALGEEKINRGDPMCLNGRHCWEYMGSTNNHHHFRHARHPHTGQVEFVYIERVRMAAGWH